MEQVQFIAEVSSNHHAQLERCLAFVDRAAEIGCDGVKFQRFRVRELFAPEILQASAAHRDRSAWELPDAFLAPLAVRARERGIRFACSPFDLAGVLALAPHVDFLKVASYELLWEPLLEACAATGRPVVLSTGMATLDEVIRAVDALSHAGCRELTLLHCVSGYPTPAGETNLAAIDTLRTLRERAPQTRIRVGWSDHSVDAGVIHRAVHRYGAQMIEFHLDLEGAGAEFAGGHCWLPEAMARVIREVRSGFDADGDGTKAPAPLERDERRWRADPMDGLRPLRETRAVWRP